MSTEPNAEREVMIQRAEHAMLGSEFDRDSWDSSPIADKLYALMADFALAETATLRQQLATAREALMNLHASGGRRTSLIAREALAKMEEQR